MIAALPLGLFDQAGRDRGPRRFWMTLSMRIERWDVRRDGALSETALRQKIESLGYEVDSRLFPAGAIAATQSDLRERLLAVVRGLVKVTLDGEAAILDAGDLVFIARGTVRRVEAIGPAAASCFEAVRPDAAA
jgi:mannose-6-phosphate isomerase-like protein (cupin superfamily)